MSLFPRLRPYATAVLDALSPDASPDALQRALDQYSAILKQSLDSEISPDLGAYLFFPLSHTLRRLSLDHLRKHPILLAHSTHALATLLSYWSPPPDVPGQLWTLISLSLPPPWPPTALIGLLSLLSVLARNHPAHSKPPPLLPSIYAQLVDAFRAPTLPLDLASALLHSLDLLVKLCPSPLIVHSLPGTVSRLVSLLTVPAYSEIARNQSTALLSLTILSFVIQTALADTSILDIPFDATVVVNLEDLTLDTPSPPSSTSPSSPSSSTRTTAWLAATAGQVHTAMLSVLYHHQDHYHTPVRAALVNLTSVLLSDCPRLLDATSSTSSHIPPYDLSSAPFATLVLQHLLVASRDSWPQVQQPASLALQNANPSLLSSSLKHALTTLPLTLQAHGDDNLKVQRVCNIISASADSLCKTLHSSSDTSLSSSIFFDTASLFSHQLWLNSFLSALDISPPTSLVFQQHDIDNPHVPWPQLDFVHLTSQSSIDHVSHAVTSLRNLAANPLSDLLSVLIQNAPETRVESLWLLAQVLSQSHSKNVTVTVARLDRKRLHDLVCTLVELYHRLDAFLDEDVNHNQKTNASSSSSSSSSLTRSDQEQNQKLDLLINNNGEDNYYIEKRSRTHTDNLTTSLQVAAQNLKSSSSSPSSALSSVVSQRFSSSDRKKHLHRRKQANRDLSICLIFQCIASTSTQLGLSFRQHFIDVLYILLSRRHTAQTPSQTLIQAFSQRALAEIAHSTGYASVDNMLVDNVDYILASVSRRLLPASSISINKRPLGHEFDPDAPNVLITLLDTCSNQTNLPHLASVVLDHVLDAIEAYHSYTLLTYRLVGVLDALSLALRQQRDDNYNNDSINNSRNVTLNSTTEQSTEMRQDNTSGAHSSDDTDGADPCVINEIQKFENWFKRRHEPLFDNDDDDDDDVLDENKNESNRNDDGDDVNEQQDNNDKDDEDTLEQKVGRAIIEKGRHLINSPDPSTRAKILNVFAIAFELLLVEGNNKADGVGVGVGVGDGEDNEKRTKKKKQDIFEKDKNHKLLPLLHKIWPMLLNTINDKRESDLNVILAGVKLLQKAIELAAEFLANRLVNEAWPLLRRTLLSFRSSSLVLSSNNARNQQLPKFSLSSTSAEAVYSSEFQIQESIINIISTLFETRYSSIITPDKKEYDPISSKTLLFTSSTSSSSTRVILKESFVLDVARIFKIYLDPHQAHRKLQQADIALYRLFIGPHATVSSSSPSSLDSITKGFADIVWLITSSPVAKWISRLPGQDLSSQKFDDEASLDNIAAIWVNV